jgi:hypothetical protein
LARAPADVDRPARAAGGVEEEAGEAEAIAIVECLVAAAASAPLRSARRAAIEANVGIMIDAERL